MLLGIMPWAEITAYFIGTTAQFFHALMLFNHRAQQRAFTVI